jgi:type VI protein secretion system component Hcp
MAESTVLMWVPEIEGASLLIGLDPGAENHQGWIPIDSCAVGCSRVSTGVDTKDDPAPDAPPPTRIEPVVVKRRADNSTAKLLVWLAKPSKKDTVLIDYCHRSGRYFLRYELIGVEIVSCSIAFEAPDTLTETITLTFDHILIRQRPVGMLGDVQVDREDKVEYSAAQPAE